MGDIDIRWMTAFLDVAAAEVAGCAYFWQLVTGSSLSSWRDQGRFATFIPPDGSPYLRIQGLDDGPPGVHIDLNVANLAVAAERATDLGATSTVRRDDLIVLRSPAGIAFCLGPVESARPEGGRRAVSGFGSLLDQVCLDIPGDAFEAECLFWSELTGWPVQAAGGPQFRVAAGPDTLPIRLLLQRRDSGDQAGAHLDFACVNRVSEVVRHQRLGSEVVGEHGQWTHLRVLSGHDYCLTVRDPQTGRLPGRPTAADTAEPR